MVTAEEVLDAFNEKLFFKQAFEYKLEDVVTFINAVADDMDGHGVQSKWKSHVGTLRDLILGLNRDVDNAKDSKRYFPEPPQLLYRENVEPSEDGLYMALDPRSLADYKVYGLYDLLGFFFGLSLAPFNAKWDNFFAPWLVIYAKWAKLLQENLEEKKALKKNGITINWKPLKSPTMLQCTWREEKKDSQSVPGDDPKPNPDNKKKSFMMGASVGGHAYDEGPYREYGHGTKKAWSQTIVEFRFNLLADPGTTKVNGKYMFTEAPLLLLTDEEEANPNEDEKSQLRKNKATEGWDYGNCAETYPFLEIFGHGPGQTAGETKKGLAIKPALALKIKKLEKYATPEISPPCANCDYLIREKYHCDVSNFLAQQATTSSS